MSSTARDREPPRSRLRSVGAFTAGLGATLGLLAGLIELSVGPHIRAWIGDKQDTTRLGLATILLSLIALAAAAAWRRQPTPGAQLLVVAGLLVPALICFTTVGRLWYLPGVLLLAGAGAALVELRAAARDVRATIGRNWLAVLTAVLAASYVFLGATALGLAGVLGILGGIAILAALAASPRIPARLRPLVLLVAALPFAALTWWSVVTPLLAILVVAIGSTALSRPRAAAPGRDVELELDISWLITRSRLDIEAIQPPLGGRAPGGAPASSSPAASGHTSASARSSDPQPHPRERTPA